MLRKILQFVNTLTKEFSILALCAMVLLVFLQIVSRVLFASSFVGTEEAARFLMIWIVFLAGGLAFQYGEHIGIDMLFNRLGNASKKITIVASSLLLFVFLAVLFAKGYELCRLTMAQTSPAMGIPMGYIYAAIPIGAVLMIANLLDVTIKLIRKLDVEGNELREESGI